VNLIQQQKSLVDRLTHCQLGEISNIEADLDEVAFQMDLLDWYKKIAEKETLTVLDEFVYWLRAEIDYRHQVKSQQICWNTVSERPKAGQHVVVVDKAFVSSKQGICAIGTFDIETGTVDSTAWSNYEFWLSFPEGLP